MSSFWRLWVASGLSNLADGIFRTALPLLALGVTRDPLLVAGVTTAATLPWLVLALPAGALADRHDRRWLMLAANGARVLALLVTGLVVLAGESSIWLLYTAAALVGIAEVVYDTSAQSTLPKVVPRGELTKANGRMMAVELAASEFVGPPLGGLLVGIGAALALFTPAGAWAIAAGALLLLRGNFRVERVSESRVLADVVEGVRFVVAHPGLRALSLMTGVFNLASSAVAAVLVLRLVGPSSAVGLDSAQYGFLLTAIAVGSVLGTFAASRVERALGTTTTMGVGLTIGALFMVAPVASSNAVVIGALFVVGGVGVMLWNLPAISLRQRVTPDRLLGRAIGVHRLVAWGTRPLGALLGGVLASWVDLETVFLSAAVMVLLTLPMLVWLRGSDTVEP